MSDRPTVVVMSGTAYTHVNARVSRYLDLCGGWPRTEAPAGMFAEGGKSFIKALGYYGLHVIVSLLHKN